jgi:hypothetical protein
VADQILGPDYPLNPAEAFVLGGSFLVHDLGLALAAYPRGLDDLKDEVVWKDAVALEFDEQQLGVPDFDAHRTIPADILDIANLTALRALHARRAESLVVDEYKYKNIDPALYLIEDSDLRTFYGHLIGRIAHSHWWHINKLVDEFPAEIGAMSGFPTEWRVDPLKIACALRVADACQLDKRRAPGFLFALRKPVGIAEVHWRAQQHLAAPVLKSNQLLFSSSQPFRESESDAWWLALELVSLADSELHDVDNLLRDTRRPPFAVNGVTGARDPSRFAKHVQTTGWTPVDAQFKVSNAADVVRKLGGTALYGNDPVVPLRELIQNARDAVHARRLIEGREESWGSVTVRLTQTSDGDRLEVVDTGVGMSPAVLTGALLDFGKSLWKSSDITAHFPGLLSKGFRPIGRFGVGFFSVFTWGSRVTVISRSCESPKASTNVLEFKAGTYHPPIMRPASPDECLNDPGTVVWVLLDAPAKMSGGLLGPGTFGGSDRSMQVQREQGWTLADLCRWLCPTIDVDLNVTEGEDFVQVVSARDWQTMSNEELMRRLLFADINSELFLRSEFCQQLCRNLRPIYDAKHQMIGRACVAPGHDFTRFLPPHEFPGVYPERLPPVGAIVTDGPFRGPDKTSKTRLLPRVYVGFVGFCQGLLGRTELFLSLGCFLVAPLLHPELGPLRTSWRVLNSQNGRPSKVGWPKPF